MQLHLTENEQLGVLKVVIFLLGVWCLKKVEDPGNPYELLRHMLLSWYILKIAISNTLQIILWDNSKN